MRVWIPENFTLKLAGRLGTPQRLKQTIGHSPRRSSIELEERIRCPALYCKFSNMQLHCWSVIMPIVHLVGPPNPVAQIK